MEVRYPKEEGQFKSEQLQARSKWFQTHLNMSRNEADALAFTEMDHIFQLEPGRISGLDPMNSLQLITTETSATAEQATDAYWKHFNRLDEKLVIKIPMQTFQKTRYYVGQNLDIYPNGRLPEPKTMLKKTTKQDP